MQQVDPESEGRETPNGGGVCERDLRAPGQLDRQEETRRESVGFDGENIIVRAAYNPEIIQYLEMIARANRAAIKFDKVRKVWVCPKSLAVDIGHIETLGHSAEFAELLSHVRAFKGCEQSLVDRVRGYVENLPATAPDGKVFYQHQTEGIRFLLKTMRVILADDMGLGKTLQALMAARGLYEVATIPAIIVTRAAILIEWRREAARQKLGAYSVHSWAKIPEPPEGRGYVVIGDEAHYAQNMRSARTKKFLKLCKGASAVFLLTGTPMANAKPSNLFPLLQAIGHPLGGNQGKFSKRFVRTRPIKVRTKAGKMVTIPKEIGAINLDELREETEPFILRRMKADCLDLPGKTRILRSVEPTGEQAAKWAALKRTVEMEVQAKIESGESKGGKAFSIYVKLATFASLEKIPETMEIANQVISEGRKVVIFANRIETVRRMAEELGVRPYLGELKPEAKADLIDQFQADSNIPALVATGDSAGTGTTLTAADTIVIHDRPQRPGDVEQWEDRLYRIGQRNAVTAYWIRLFDIDLILDDLLEAKQKIIAEVIDGAAEGGAGGTITAEEIIGRLL